MIGGSTATGVGAAVGAGGKISPVSTVGRYPTGTVITLSTPLTVTVMDVFAFVGREQ